MGTKHYKVKISGNSSQLFHRMAFLDNFQNAKENARHGVFIY